VPENRYFYLSASGKPNGPVWLGEMRRLWQSGGIGSETLVCAEGDDNWDAARLFPEITSDEARLPDEENPKPPEPTISLGVWLLILTCATYMYVMYYFFGR
jgi:hypothetical protein